MGIGGVVASMIEEDLVKIKRLLKDETKEIGRLDVETYINKYNTIVYGLAKEVQPLISRGSPDYKHIMEVIEFKLIEYKLNGYKAPKLDSERKELAKQVKEYLSNEDKNALGGKVAPKKVESPSTSTSSFEGGAKPRMGGMPMYTTPYTPPSRNISEPVKDGNIYDSVDNI